MKTGWRSRAWPSRCVQLICVCCLLPFSVCSHAQKAGTASPGASIPSQSSGISSRNAGTPFWYEPSHDRWVATEFYGAPQMNAPTIRLRTKTRILVLFERQGWYVIRAEIAGTPTLLFMPVRMFKFRLYKPAPAGDINAAFQRASLFEVDPDVIQRQLEGKDQDSTSTVKTAPTGKLKPWQKYKESWGSLNPPPKKKKYLLLDDIKQPEEAPETPP